MGKRLNAFRRIGDEPLYLVGDAERIDAIGQALAGREKGQPSSGRAVPSLPPIKPLFDYPMRDTSICLGPNGTYYLTGTTGHPTWWRTNDGVRLWKSKDLKKWAPLGLVWSIEKDGTWQKGFVKGRRAVWAPEIHYLNGTFWIPYSMNYPDTEPNTMGGTGLLKSLTGKPEGPYVDVKQDGPLTFGIDASLFQDDDGTVYFLHGNGKIARMTEDMSGLAEKSRQLKPRNYKHVGFEGAFLTKMGSRYLLVCAEFNGKGPGRTYDSMIASSDNLYGPYGDRYLAIPHGGHNTLFKDRDGKWWATFFGNDKAAPFRERPAILRIEIDSNGRIRPVQSK
ncbi:MAG: family 43 glycosylhydrolase [Kiritimatiellaeota bacterium]|nr:family 43 glycosylhydrolase [Kiritimatiellota bacterium]